MNSLMSPAASTPVEQDKSIQNCSGSLRGQKICFSHLGVFTHTRDSICLHKEKVAEDTDLWWEIIGPLILGFRTKLVITNSLLILRIKGEFHV